MSAVAKLFKGLVSKTDEALGNLKREKGTGAEFLRELEKAPGVKPAEIKDRGLDKVLPAMGKTTKAEVKKALEKNPPPRIEETVLGGKKQISDADVEREYRRIYGDPYTSDGERLDISEMRDMVTSETSGVGSRLAPKYGEYQLPGGQNYREILLKLPRRDEDLGQLNYHSQHWEGEPNVLAHARVSDRVGPNGEKILHVEEIQSDWHQSGRKQGYQTPEKRAEEKERFAAKLKAKVELEEIQRKYNEAKQFSQSLDAKIASPEFDALPADKQAQFRESAKSWGEAWLSKLPELMKARKVYEDIPDVNEATRTMVPDAPFKKNWHELTMKRLLNYAAENNYDRMAITPGQTQADRFGLSNVIDEINVTGRTDAVTGEKSKSVALDTKSGVSLRLGVAPDGTIDNVNDPLISNYIGKNLDEVIGKELSQKVMQGNTQTIAGENLKVGGEGMKGFYDKILPDYLNSLGKPYGTSVGRMQIEAGQEMSRGASGNQMVPTYTPKLVDLHTFDITPQMRQEIASKGLPLYSVPAIEGAALTGAGAATLGATEKIEEEKAPVHISDNPDTMRMELEDKKMQAGGIARLAQLAKAGKKMTPVEEAALRAKGMGVPGFDFADPLTPASMRMSEALGNVGAEGKVLNFTEADRSRVFGPNRGGVGFSALQLYSEPHKKAGSSWGFGNQKTAEKKIKQNKPGESLWTTFVGAPDQHKSNTVVIKDAIEDFQRAVKAGEVHPAQIKLMNQRLRSLKDENTGTSLFDPAFDLTDPGALAAASTFSRRSGIGDVLLGTGVKGEMRSKAFKEKHGDQPWSKAGQMEEILKRETDPDLVGAGTYDVGNRLFTMEGEIIHRPDLNLAFPYQVTGEDLGMKFLLTPKEKAMRDWMKQYEGRLGKTGKPAPVGYMDLARNRPSQFVSDDYLTFLQKEGFKKGGEVNKKGKVQVSSKADVMLLELKSKRK